MPHHHVMELAMEAYGCRLTEWPSPDPAKWNYGSPPDHLWIPPKPSPQEYESEEHQRLHELLVSRVQRYLESILEGRPHIGSDQFAQRLAANFASLLHNACCRAAKPGIARVNSMLDELNAHGFP